MSEKTLVKRWWIDLGFNLAVSYSYGQISLSSGRWVDAGHWAAWLDPDTYGTHVSVSRWIWTHQENAVQRYSILIYLFFCFHFYEKAFCGNWVWACSHNSCRTSESMVGLNISGKSRKFGGRLILRNSLSISLKQFFVSMILEMLSWYLSYFPGENTWLCFLMSMNYPHLPWPYFYPSSLFYIRFPFLNFPVSCSVISGYLQWLTHNVLDAGPP